MIKLRGVCIGVGYFSQFHYEAWNRIENVEIIAICDIDESHANEVASKWNIATVYTDYKEMLAAEKPDFVDIITPPSTHYSICAYIADQGISMICQKPLAPSYQEAVDLVQKVKQTGTRLMVHSNFRFQPWHREIKKLLENKVIGENTFSVNFLMRMGDGWGGDAYLDRQPYFRQMPRLLVYETGIHFVDIFRYLFGEIETVYAKLRKLNPVIAGEDCAYINFGFASGMQGNLDANRYNEANVPNSRYTFGEMRIDGEGGTILLMGDGSITIKCLGEEPVSHVYSPSENNFAGDCVFETQSHFIARLIDGAEFETHGEEYLNNVKVQEAIYASSKSGLPVHVNTETLN